MRHSPIDVAIKGLTTTYRHGDNTFVKTKTAIEHFKTQWGLADALGLYQSTVAGWGDYPPEIQQVKLEKITRGRLKAEPSCYLPLRPKVSERAA